MGVFVRVLLCSVSVFAATIAFANDFDDLAARAKSAREANDLSGAIGLYQKALALKPDWPDGWWFLGTLAYDSDQYGTCRSAFTEFVKLEDKAGPGWAFLGLCEFEAADYPHALEHIRRGIELGAERDPAIGKVVRFHEGIVLTKLGLFDQALPAFMPLVRGGIQNPVLTSAVGLASLRRALLPKEIPADQSELISSAGKAAYLWMTGDATRTGPAFQEVVKAYPSAPGVHYLYATYLLSFRPAEEAVAELKRELEVNPHSAEARATVALLMFRAGENAPAQTLARQAAQDGPNCPIAQYTLGLILAQQGDLSRAIQHLETAERLDPANVEYHMGLAGAYSKSGRDEDARRERRISIRLARGSDSRGSG